MSDSNALPIPIEGEEFHHAMWTHGVNAQLGWEPALPGISNAQIKEMVDIAVLVRTGTGARIEMVGSLSGAYVVHFPIATQSVQPGLRLRSIILDFNARVGVIGKVEARDGNRTIATFANLALGGEHSLEIFDVTERPPIFKGVNVSVTLEAGIGNAGVVEFRAVGIQLVRRTGELPPTPE